MMRSRKASNQARACALRVSEAVMAALLAGPRRSAPLFLEPHPAIIVRAATQKAAMNAARWEGNDEPCRDAFLMTLLSGGRRLGAWTGPASNSC